MSRFLLLMCLSGCLTGCAFSRYGRVNKPGEKEAFSPGTRIEQVVSSAGAPDKYAKVGETELLSYRVEEGWWVFVVIFSLNFGHSTAGDVELSFEDGVLTSLRYKEGGGSIGIYAPQSAIAE